MRVFESGQGPVWVLIHGMFGDHLDWEPVIAPLAERYRVMAVDLPGFGESEKRDAPYSGEFFVESLRERLGELRVTLVGNSFGGQIAMLYALAYPEQVERLVLVDSGGFARYSQAEQRWLLEHMSEAAIRSLTPERNRALFAPLFVHCTPVVERYLAKQEAKLARADYPAYARALAASIRLSVETCLLDRLGEIRTRTLLVWGEQDRVVPVALAREALGRFPQAELRVLAGCGHVPQLDCPERFLQALA